jgi:hypothetical protein
MTQLNRDADLNKGAVEQHRPSQDTNTSMQGQLPHREQNPTIKAQDTDYPEPGETPEHSGEPQGSSLLNRDAGCGKPDVSPEGETQDQDPGNRQKRNQAEKEDDPLAA